jgi:diaminohydroxyphosphoribosylaminopyrimidine deaminase/5-amino-6-(5-phosphoribosylamino)uracil reductase
VRLKVAASLDGRTALHNGVSQWITDAAAREDGQRWRARASAILTGVGTVLADNPRLDVRALATPRPPLRVVLDSHWRMPTASAMLHTPGGVLVVGLAVGDEATARRQQALQAAGAEVCVAPRAPLAPAQQAFANGPQGVPSATAHVGIDLAWLWPELARRGINELHVEAGARLNGSLLAADAVDELLLYLAPKLLGPGRGLADLPALQALSGAWQGEVHSLAQVGADVRLQLRPPGRAHF